MANPKLPEAREVGLKEYNKIRRKNGLPNLTLDDIMNEDAQSHAEYLVQSGKFETTTMGKYATNIATSSDARIFDAVKDAIERTDKQTGKRFYVKEGCNRMGMGIAKNESTKKWIIVMFYENPPARRESLGTKSLRNIFSNA